MIIRIMQSGRFNADAGAMELFVNTAISFSAQKDEHMLICKWFKEGKITGNDGAAIAGTNVNI